MPHLSLCLPLPLHWAAFARRKEEKMAMEITLHHPPTFPSPPFSVSLPFNLTPADAASSAHILMQPREDGGGARPLFPTLSVSPWWNAVDSAGLQFPPISTPLPPGLSALLQQCLSRHQKHRSKTFPYLNEEKGKYALLK